MSVLPPGKPLLDPPYDELMWKMMEIFDLTWAGNAPRTRAAANIKAAMKKINFLPTQPVVKSVSMMLWQAQRDAVVSYVYGTLAEIQKNKKRWTP